MVRWWQNATTRTVIVVVDTNVFVGVCLGIGAANAVVAACLRGEHRPLMGATLLTEYEDVLARRSLFTKCRLTAGERDELLDVFLAGCLWTRIYFGWRSNLKGEADNHVVELAVAGCAQRIITRNVADFAAMELRFPGVTVVSPVAFLKETAQ